MTHTLSLSLFLSLSLSLSHTHTHTHIHTHTHTNTHKHTHMAALMSKIGTPSYFAPERGNDQAYGFMADMWALGCVLIELITTSRLTRGLWHAGPEVSERREKLLQQVARTNEGLGRLAKELLNMDKNFRLSASALNTQIRILDEIKPRVEVGVHMYIYIYIHIHIYVRIVSTYMSLQIINRWERALTRYVCTYTFVDVCTSYNMYAHTLSHTLTRQTRYIYEHIFAYTILLYVYVFMNICLFTCSRCSSSRS
jgi:serine/threonine protein kinase